MMPRFRRSGAPPTLNGALLIYSRRIFYGIVMMPQTNVLSGIARQLRGGFR